MKIHRGALAVALPGLLSGCSFLGPLTGVEFVPSYSPEQEEVFLTTLDSSIDVLSGGKASVSTENRDAFLEFGSAICTVLATEPREAVLESLGRVAAQDFPSLDEGNIQQMGEIFILAATAQGSLCP